MVIVLNRGGIFMSSGEIRQLEKEIWEQTVRLEMLRKNNKATKVKNYQLQTLGGKTSLMDCFAGKDKMLVIHNMGQNCRWCTAWGDIINAALPYLESEFSVVLVSGDLPQAQRTFALSRHWDFRMVSHSNNEYISEQSIISGEKNIPGIVCYERSGENILLKNASAFYPGDAFNPIFHLLSVGGIGLKEFKPQFNYWNKPEKLDESMAQFHVSH
jgi:predicted dithiol-disulfide oxidoreductase (DUF899 family)